MNPPAARKNSALARSARRLEIESDGATVRLTLGGAWSLKDGLADTGPIGRALAVEGIEALKAITDGLEGSDSSLGVYLATIHDLCAQRGVRFDLTGVEPGLAKLVGLARAVPEQTDTDHNKDPRSRLEQVGHRTIAALRQFDGDIRFLGELTLSVGRLLTGQARFRWRDVREALEDCGPRSIVIVSVISALIGMILAFIGAVQLRKFGAGIYIADLVGLAMSREMAAVMTGIVIAGKTGASFAARLGTMQAQEEIDALTTLGLSPIDFLVLPRMIALALMMPLLYLYACGIGLTGGVLVSTTVLDLTVGQYWHQTLYAVGLKHFIIGLSKSVVFGVLVALAGCMRGIQCGRSAAAVGEATTSAVVTGILYIIITDAVFAVLLEVFGL
ncbi:MAG: ABC transporter permease [Rhodospirillaceae bacterium]